MWKKRTLLACAAFAMMSVSIMNADASSDGLIEEELPVEEGMEPSTDPLTDEAFSDEQENDPDYELDYEEPDADTGNLIVDDDEGYDGYSDDLSDEDRTKDTFTLSFDSAGGEAIASQEYAGDIWIYDLPDPVREHYTFCGWTDEWDTYSEYYHMPDHDVTLQAKWEPVEYEIRTYTIDDWGDESLFREYTYNVESEPFTLEEPKLEEHTFLGWTSSQNSKPIKNLTVQTGSFGDKEYHANWRKPQITVKFDGNGGKGSLPNLSCTFEADVKLKASSLTRTGYTFLGWSVDKQDPIYDWEVEEYPETIPAIYYGPEYTDAQIDFNDGESLNWYEFTDRLEYANYSGELHNGDVVTLHAVWAIDYFHVVCKDHDGTVLGDMYVSYGTPVSLLKSKLTETPYKKGYKWTGWNTKTTKITSDLTLKSVYKIRTYRIVFDAKGGTCSTKEKIYTYNKKMGTLPVPKKKNCKFLYWVAYDKYGDAIKLTSSTLPQKWGRNEFRAYAKWATKIKVRFNANKGRVSKKSKYAWSSTTYGTLPTPTRAGYKFMGWYTKAGGGKKVTKNSKTPTKSLTLYAHWFGPLGTGSTMTLAEFKRIKEGMTYSQVKLLVGGPGTLISSYGGYKSYMWEGNTSYGIGIVSFDDTGRCNGKSQTYLR